MNDENSILRGYTMKLEDYPIPFKIKVMKFMYYHFILFVILTVSLVLIVSDVVMYYLLRLDFIFKLLFISVVDVALFFLMLKILGRLYVSSYKLKVEIANDVIHVSRDMGRPLTPSDILTHYKLTPELASDVYDYLSMKGFLKEFALIEQAQKELISMAEKTAGLLSINKAIAISKLPIPIIQKAFEYLEKQGLIKKVYENIYDFLGVREFSDQEKEIIKLAYNNSGQLTLEEISLKTGWNVETILSLLESLENRGIAVKATFHGKQVWYFPSIIQPKEKETESN